MFEEALGLTLQLATDGPAAFRLFVTNALDDDAARFYEHFELQRLWDVFPVRMVLDINRCSAAQSSATVSRTERPYVAARGKRLLQVVTGTPIIGANA